MRQVKDSISVPSCHLEAIPARMSKTGARFVPEGNHMKPKRVALYVRVSTGEQNADMQVN